MDVKKERRTLAPVIGIGPFKHEGQLISFGQYTDIYAQSDTKGGLKRIVSTGVKRCDSQEFINGLGQWHELTKTWPGAKASAFVLSYSSGVSLYKQPKDSSAYSHRDCVARA